MLKRWYAPIVAAVMVLALVLGVTPAVAAEEPVQVTLTEGKTKLQDVVDALNKSLGVEGTVDNWQYQGTATSIGNTITRFVSINGETISEREWLFTRNYNFSSIPLPKVDSEPILHTVKLNDQEYNVHISVWSNKQSVIIALNAGVEVPIPVLDVAGKLTGENLKTYELSVLKQLVANIDGIEGADVESLYNSGMLEVQYLGKPDSKGLEIAQKIIDGLGVQNLIPLPREKAISLGGHNESLGLFGQEIDVPYPAIHSGEQVIYVKYVGDDTHRSCTAEATVTITATPVFFSVNSSTIRVNNPFETAQLLSAVRADNLGDGTAIQGVTAHTVYAGLTSDANLLLTLDLGGSTGDIADLVASIFNGSSLDLKSGISLQELLKNLDTIQGAIENSPILGGAALPSLDLEQLLTQAIKALANVLGGDLTDEQLQGILDLIPEGSLDQVLAALQNVLSDGLGALTNVGIDATFRLGTPAGQAGVYAVASYLDDANYEAEGNPVALGYLLIRYNPIAVTVNGGNYGAGQAGQAAVLPEEHPNAKLSTAYAGVNSGVTTHIYLVVPEGYQLNDVSTVGDLRRAIAADASRVLGMVGSSSGIYAKLLQSAMGLSDVLDGVPVTYCTAEEVPAGAYAVTAMAYEENYGYGLATGGITVALKDVESHVGTAVVCKGTSLPADFVTVAAGVDHFELYFGLNAAGKLVAYVDGIEDPSFAGVVSVADLRAYLASRASKVAQTLGINNEHLASVLAQIFEQENRITAAVDSLTVAQGVPDELGIYRVYSIAGGFGYKLSVAKGTLTVAPHDLTLDEFTAATCEAGGTLAYHCKRCDHAVNEETEALGHAYLETPAKAATCTEWGYTGGKLCVRCGDYEPICPVKPTGHTKIEIEAVAATCVNTGLTAGEKCSVCDTILVAQQVVPLAEHAWGEGEVVPSTCTIKGNTKYTCSVCHEVKEVAHEVDETKHNWQPVERIDATCETDGVVPHQRCQDCGALNIENVTIPKKDHQWDEGAVTLDATCETDGMMTYTCLNDASHTYSKPIPAVGHTPEILPNLPPSCTTTGLTEGAKCSVCHEVLVEQTEIPALGHTFSDWRIVTPATSTQAGLQEHWCTVCGAKETQEIPALGTGNTGGDNTNTGNTDDGTSTGNTDGGDANNQSNNTTNDGGESAGSNDDADQVGPAVVIPENQTPLAPGVSVPTALPATTNEASEDAEPTDEADGEAEGVTEETTVTTSAEAEEIADDETPLVRNIGGNWSVVSLVCIMASVLVAALTVLKTLRNSMAAHSAIMLVTSVLLVLVSAVTFFATSNLVTVVVANAFTPLHVVLLAGTIIAFVLVGNRESVRERR